MTGALKMFEEQWVEKGRLEGREEGRKEIAIAMLRDGKLSDQNISMYSGLSLEEVKTLADELR